MVRLVEFAPGRSFRWSGRFARTRSPEATVDKAKAGLQRARGGNGGGEAPARQTAGKVVQVRSRAPRSCCGHPSFLPEGKLMSDGCWVQFWDGEEYRDATLRFDGPKSVNNLDDYTQSDGDKEGDEPDSLKTGSRSWLVVYKDNDYGGKSAMFGPNTEVPDLDVYGLGGNISSFMLYDSRPPWFVESKVGGPFATETTSSIVNAEGVNNYLRTVVSASLNMIPVVGGTIGTLVGGLWPDVSNEEQVWACGQNYVNQAVAGVYWQITYTDLNAMLSSLYSAASRYVNTPDSEHDSKVDNFTNLFDEVGNAASYFVDENYPESKLSFFVPYASLHLATLRENLQHYAYYHGSEPGAEYRAQLTEEIQELISNYQALLTKARDRVIDRRMQLIVVQEDSRNNYLVVDLFNGWRGQITDRTRADRHLTQYKERVANHLALMLDVNNAVSQLWSWFDPEKALPVTAPVIDYSVGPFGDYQGATSFDQRGGDRAVTQLSLWSGSLIDALQLTFDGVAQSKVGGSGGAQQSLSFASGTGVQSVSGYATGVINALTFTTSDGRTMSGGNGGTNPNAIFDIPPLPGSTSTRLTGLSGQALAGNQSTDNIKALTFHFRCALTIDEQASA
ncbi:MAG: hypothetical protein JNN30_21460 [Rhodanobacteraceae bacterium]|nr:hypothetical protein [Rhodanobacteraceae bacterium]